MRLRNIRLDDEKRKLTIAALMELFREESPVPVVLGVEALAGADSSAALAVLGASAAYHSKGPGKKRKLIRKSNATYWLGLKIGFTDHALFY